jgi:hypothetical protein
LKRKVFPLALAAALAVGATTTLASADPKGPPAPIRQLPPQAQAALDRLKDPDGRVDASQLRLPARGADGQLQRNADGSTKLFGPDDLPNPLPPVTPGRGR